MARAIKKSVHAPSAYEREIALKRAHVQQMLAPIAAGLRELKNASTPARAPKVPRARKPAGIPTRRSARASKAPTAYVELDSDDDETPAVRRSRTTKRSTSSSPRSSTSPNTDSGARFKTPKGHGKRFGAIPNVAIGTRWAKREHCARTGIHPPYVNGIFGGKESGCYSVCVSGGYAEDEDDGDTFTFTGSGGRELSKKNLRTAAQSKNQLLTRGNAGLWTSSETGKPVRVVRGYKGDLGPVSGYRYDGLYKVVRAWEAPNATGAFLVYKFAFERLPGQEPADYHEKARAAANAAVNVPSEDEGSVGSGKRRRSRTSTATPPAKRGRASRSSATANADVPADAEAEVRPAKRGRATRLSAAAQQEQDTEPEKENQQVITPDLIDSQLLEDQRLAENDLAEKQLILEQKEESSSDIESRLLRAYTDKKATAANTSEADVAETESTEV